MKILVISDTHIHTWESSNVDRKAMLTKQFLAQVELLGTQVADIVCANKVDLFVHGGDWFHEVGEVPTECLNIVNRFFDTLKGARVKSLLVSGNHDIRKRIDTEWYHNIINAFRSVDDINAGGMSKFEYNDVKFGVINYQDEINYHDMVGRDIVIVHKTPIGATLDGYTFKKGIDWNQLATNNRLVFIGHIHKRQMLSDNCYIIGSPMHFDFGDKDERGVYLIDTDLWSVEFIKLKYPEFRTVDTIDQVEDDYNYYRVLRATDSRSADNVIVVNKPRVFEERIKSSTVFGICEEWAKINNVDDNYVNAIKDDLGKADSATRNVKPYRLELVQIKDFMSIGEVSYVPEKGFTMLSGDSQCFSSNGSGKSSMVDAIYWALTGKTTKGLTGDDVIRRGGPKDAIVELDLFDEAEGKLTVARSRKEGLVIKDLEKELTAGLRQNDRQLLLQQLLGFDGDLYMSSCYFSQESLSMLTEMTDVDRTNMITSLLGFNVYDELYTTMKNNVDSRQPVLRDVEARIADFNHRIDKAYSNIEWGKSEKEGCEANIRQEESTIFEAQERIDRLDRKPPIEIKVDETDYEVQLAEFKKEKEQHSAKIAILNENLEALRAEKNSAYGQSVRMQSTGKSLKEDIRTLEVRNENLRTLAVNERCDKCGSVITEENRDCFIEENNIKIEQKKEQLEQVSTEIMTFSNQEISINEKVDVINKECNELTKKLGTIEKYIEDTNQKKLAQVESKNALEREKAKIASAREGLENEIKLRESYIEKYKKKVAEYEEGIKSNEVQVNLFQEELARAAEEEKKVYELITIYEFWKDAFSSKGIKSLLLDKFCNDINSIVNECLSTVSNGSMAVVVTPTSFTKGGDERNRLGIEIQYDGDIVEYKSLSGGEKCRIDFGVCVALNKYVEKRFGLKTGLLGLIVFDELFSHLDKSGEELIGAYLQKLGRELAVLAITQTDRLSLYADRHWTMVKENKVSRLEV